MNRRGFLGVLGLGAVSAVAINEGVKALPRPQLVDAPVKTGKTWPATFDGMVYDVNNDQMVPASEYENYWLLDYDNGRTQFIRRRVGTFKVGHRISYVDVQPAVFPDSWPTGHYTVIQVGGDTCNLFRACYHVKGSLE